jgi:hypothetical protein
MTSAVIHEVTNQQFHELFTSVRRAWFRLETLQRYDATSERDASAAFLRGEPIETTPGSWQEMIRRHVANGRDLSRVHVVQEPLTDSIRFELEIYTPKRRGGRRRATHPHPARHLADGRATARLLALRRPAPWLMDYDANDAFQAARLVEDPAVIDQRPRPDGLAT